MPGRSREHVKDDIFWENLSDPESMPPMPPHPDNDSHQARSGYARRLETWQSKSEAKRKDREARIKNAPVNPA